MADVTAIQADLVERARLFIDEGASEDPRSLVEGLLMLLDLHDPPTAPVPAVTRDQVRAAVADIWHETGRVEVLTLERMADAVMALQVEAPQEGMSEDDVEYVCEALMEVGGWDEIDGDGTNASIIAEHIRRLPRVLEDRSTQPKVLWEGDLNDLLHAVNGTPLMSPLLDAAVAPDDPDAHKIRVAVVALGPPVPEAPEGGSDAG